MLWTGYVDVGYMKRLGANLAYRGEVPLMGLCPKLGCWTRVTVCTFKHGEDDDEYHIQLTELSVDSVSPPVRPSALHPSTSCLVYLSGVQHLV
jgi:hypothetical protein